MSEYYFKSAGLENIYYKRMAQAVNENIDDISIPLMAKEVIEIQIKKSISKNDLEKVLHILEIYNNSDFSQYIVNQNKSFFASVNPNRMKKILNNKLAWIKWLEINGHTEILNNITIV
jgi:hypothetical protein